MEHVERHWARVARRGPLFSTSEKAPAPRRVAGLLVVGKQSVNRESGRPVTYFGEELTDGEGEAAAGGGGERGDSGASLAHGGCTAVLTSSRPSVRRVAVVWPGSGTLSRAWSRESDGNRCPMRSLLSWSHSTSSGRLGRCGGGAVLAQPGGGLGGWTLVVAQVSLSEWLRWWCTSTREPFSSMSDLSGPGSESLLAPLDAPGWRPSLTWRRYAKRSAFADMSDRYVCFGCCGSASFLTPTPGIVTSETNVGFDGGAGFSTGLCAFSSGSGDVGASVDENIRVAALFCRTL